MKIAFSLAGFQPLKVIFFKQRDQNDKVASTSAKQMLSKTNSYFDWNDRLIRDNFTKNDMRFVSLV